MSLSRGDSPQLRKETTVDPRLPDLSDNGVYGWFEVRLFVFILAKNSHYAVVIYYL